ncbi:MAG: radical SAM protein [Lachnospiraceae bacterium]|nr:radical SAM protein [Lachnospiraceae bacterium]
MKLSKRVLKYAREHFDEVKHTTFNPDGPGVVRIHLIPPKLSAPQKATDAGRNPSAPQKATDAGRSTSAPQKATDAGRSPSAPQKAAEEEIGPSVAIINGQDIIPVNVSWTILLAEFISEVNKYSGRAVGKEESDQIINATCKRMRKIYPFLPSSYIASDIRSIMDTFIKIARREEIETGIPYMNLGEYAPYMRAPHRMDLMVSPMTKDGGWHCNLKCLHCYAAGQTHSGEEELSTEDWKKIIDKLKKAGVPQITFTGGEPTMRPDLAELIGYSKWFVTRLNTNGVKLTKEYCHALKGASLDSLQITFYSKDREIHNKLVGADGYDRTLEGIKNALELNMSLSINTPLCTLNADYVKTLEFLHELGVMYVTCSGLITTGNALKEESTGLQLGKEEISRILREAVSYCFSHDMEISFTSPGWVDPELCEELGINTPTCGACLSNMAVTPGGNAVPCQSWLSGETLGNLLADDWKTIWDNEKCKERRDYSAKMTGLCPLRKGGAAE